MSKIEIGRWSEQLRRMLGQKGQEFVAGELSPEISATIELERPSVEWDFLKGVRQCANGTRLAGAVGFTTRFRLLNPLDSGVIGLVTLVNLTLATTGDFVQFGFARGQVDLPLPSVSVVLDHRWDLTGLTRTSLTVSADNTSGDAIDGRVFVRTRSLANVPIEYKNEIVLVPGSSLNWGTGSTNVAGSTYLRWRERGLPRLEQ